MPRHASPHLPVVFSHANSFPAGTYRLLFKYLKERGMDVSAVERFGHEPQYPVTNNWPHLVQQLVDFTQAQVQRIGDPVYLVGHSLGGFLSVMAAARHPELARGVVLIDSPLIGGWRANALGVAKHTQVVGALSPGKVSSRRRESWASNEEALEHFRKKKAFAGWHPQVLQDYIEHGLQDHAGKRVLAFDRAVETAITTPCPTTWGACSAPTPCVAPWPSLAGVIQTKCARWAWP